MYKAVIEINLKEDKLIEKLDKGIKFIESNFAEYRGDTMEDGGVFYNPATTFHNGMHDKPDKLLYVLKKYRDDLSEIYFSISKLILNADDIKKFKFTDIKIEKTSNLKVVNVYFNIDAEKDTDIMKEVNKAIEYTIDDYSILSVRVKNHGAMASKYDSNIHFISIPCGFGEHYAGRTESNGWFIKTYQEHLEYERLSITDYISSITCVEIDEDENSGPKPVEADDYSVDNISFDEIRDIISRAIKLVDKYNYDNKINEIKDTFEISRSPNEIKGIWIGILRKGTLSDKQKKYASLALYLVNT